LKIVRASREDSTPQPSSSSKQLDVSNNKLVNEADALKSDDQEKMTEGSGASVRKEWNSNNLFETSCIIKKNNDGNSSNNADNDMKANVDDIFKSMQEGKGLRHVLIMHYISRSIMSLSHASF
jgi:hypothetical protein